MRDADEALTGQQHADRGHRVLRLSVRAPRAHHEPDADRRQSEERRERAVLVDRRIYEACVSSSGSPEQAVEFFHGYTYSGHPLACAAGLATLAVYREEGLFARAASVAAAFADALHSLKGAPHVIDVRNIGLMGAVELEPRKGEPTRITPPSSWLATAISSECDQKRR